LTSLRFCKKKHNQPTNQPPIHDTQAVAYFVGGSPNPAGGLIDFYILGPLNELTSPKLRTKDFVVREK